MSQLWFNRHCFQALIESSGYFTSLQADIMMTVNTLTCTYKDMG